MAVITWWVLGFISAIGTHWVFVYTAWRDSSRNGRRTPLITPRVIAVYAFVGLFGAFTACAFAFITCLWITFELFDLGDRIFSEDFWDRTLVDLEKDKDNKSS